MFFPAINENRCYLYASLDALGVHSFDASDLFSKKKINTGTALLKTEL